MVRLIDNQTVLYSELWKSYPWKSFIMKENIIELRMTKRAAFTLQSFEVVILVLFPKTQHYSFFPPDFYRGSFIFPYRTLFIYPLDCIHIKGICLLIKNNFSL